LALAFAVNLASGDMARVMRCFVLGTTTLLLCALPVGSPVSAAPPAAHPAELTFSLRLVRQDIPAATTGTSGTVPASSTLSEPTLTTVDGQTASIEVKGTDATFFVSLSPTLEPADNANKLVNSATVRVYWHLRLSGKTLPGGVTAAALSGATRLKVDDTPMATISKMSLADPKTGGMAEYRLEGRATLGDSPAATGNSGAATVVTPVPPKP
jgi:hypothetical protein